MGILLIRARSTSAIAMFFSKTLQNLKRNSSSSSSQRWQGCESKEFRTGVDGAKGIIKGLANREEVIVVMELQQVLVKVINHLLVAKQKKRRQN